LFFIFIVVFSSFFLLIMRKETEATGIHTTKLVS
jgi:hypothetical protein